MGKGGYTYTHTQVNKQSQQIKKRENPPYPLIPKPLRSVSCISAEFVRSFGRSFVQGKPLIITPRTPTLTLVYSVYWFGSFLPFRFLIVIIIGRRR